MSARMGLRKPDPDSCALITTVAHCRPGEVLHVGNNLETDVIGPARCGMRTAQPWSAQTASLPTSGSGCRLARS
jgi:FMN phosphatase YigB (HAD superfamily)